MRRARRGDLEAYDELVRRHQERIYATIYHMTANHEDANDLVQDALIKAYKSIGSFKGQSSFYTWVYRIAVNRTINFLKRRRRRATTAWLTSCARRLMKKKIADARLAGQ